MWKFSKHEKKLKLSLSARQKTLLSYVNLTYSRLKGQGIFSLDINKVIRLQVTLDSPHAYLKPPSPYSRTLA